MPLKFYTLLTTLLTTTLLHLTTIHSLNLDGTSLLAFKYSILNDPTSVLTTWDYLDENPCSWTGVLCDTNSNVVTLSLPNKQLLGSIPPDIGQMQNLKHIDLSNNILNGTLPKTLFNSSNNNIRIISLSSNIISGDIFDFLNSSITVLNISNNAFIGTLPLNFSEVFNNLTVLSLKGNYFTGNVPSEFPPTVQTLDISSNLLNGTLPTNLRVGSSLNYLNLSYNNISGEIPVEFGSTLLENATIDLSYNNLTGEIPGLKTLQAQNPGFFSGNKGLCGKPLKNLCVIPSTFSNPPKVTATISPAIAVIPIPVGSDSDSGSTNGYGSGSGSGNAKMHSGLKPAAIVGITLADLAGVAILGAIFLYFYQARKKKHGKNDDFVTKKASIHTNADNYSVQISAVSLEPKKTVMHSECLSRCLTGNGNESEGTATESRNSSESEDGRNSGLKKETENASGGGGGELVMVDGETEMEVETLLKASAYILGASGSSIVYKAVLQDGRTFAVRRLGEIGCGKLKEFDGHVKAIAKVKHPNVVRVRGFYWASDEKLVIYDYISNGTLATSAQKKGGSTPYNLPLEARLRIARGLARGLSHIHEKRLVHANIKPSNILLTPDMEPVISDLGLSWLVCGNNGSKGSGSARQFGSKRSMGSYDGTQELSVSGSPYINPFGGTNGAGSPYHAPESLKNLKPNPKWDVYSFGIVLLELLTGKVYLDRDLGQWTPSSGLEDRYWVLRIADVALRAEIQGKEDAMTSIFKLGFNCASLVPQKRPSMKDALQILEKVSLSFV